MKFRPATGKRLTCLLKRRQLGDPNIRLMRPRRKRMLPTMTAARQVLGIILAFKGR